MNILHQKVFASSYYIPAEGFCFKNDTYFASESDRNTSFVVIRSGAAIDRSCIGYNITDVSTQGNYLLCPL